MHKKKKTIKTIIFFLFISIPILIQGQNTSFFSKKDVSVPPKSEMKDSLERREYIEAYFDKEIPDSTKIRIINESRLLFGTYIKHADFCEDNICEVNMTSVDRFKNLFESNALVIDDLFPGLQKVDINDYTIGIYNYLQKRGVQYDWRNPDNDHYDFIGEIASIKKTKDDYERTEYYCSLHFIKVMFVRLTKKGKVIELKGKNKVEIPLTIKIVMDEEFSNAKIAEISLLKAK